MDPYRYVPDPRELRRRALQADGNFIGTGMLILTFLMQFSYTAVVLLLSLFGVVAPENLAAADLGLGNTGYLLVYMGIYAVMMGLPMVLAALLFRRRIQPFSPGRRLPPGQFIGGLLAAMALCVVANIVTNYIMLFLGSFGIPAPEMPDLLEHTPTSFVLNLLVFAVLPAFLEEMVFRGYVLQTLRPYGDRLAVIVSSLLFSLMHGNILQIPFALIVGLVLGYAVVQSNTIWLAVTIHFANNAMATVLDYLQLGMTDDTEKDRMTLVVFSVLAIVGLTALIVLKARHSRLTAPPARNADAQSTGSLFKGLFTSPVFVLCVTAFVLVTLLSVVLSLQGG